MKSLRVLAGSCVVYLVVAACSGMNLGGGSGGHRAGNGGSGGHHAGSGGGGSGQVGSGGFDAGEMFDALIDPVSDAIADPTTSGSRLKAKFWVGSDGSRSYLYYQFFDSMLGVDCSVSENQVMSDGKVRCVPSATAAIGNSYSDVACTKIIILDTCSSKYAWSIDTSSCGPNTVHVFPIVGAPSKPATIYVKSGNTCIATPNAGNLDYSPIGAELPPSTFVDGSYGHDP